MQVSPRSTRFSIGVPVECLEQTFGVHHAGFPFTVLRSFFSVGSTSARPTSTAVTRFRSRACRPMKFGAQRQGDEQAVQMAPSTVARVITHSERDGISVRR